MLNKIFCVSSRPTTQIQNETILWDIIQKLLTNLHYISSIICNRYIAGTFEKSRSSCFINFFYIRKSFWIGFHNLINILHITGFTENFLRPIRSIRCSDFFTTFTTVSLVELSWISELHQFSISLSWMYRRKWYGVFDMKSELWSDNLKWFTTDRTTENNFENVINILLCYFWTNNFLIVLRDMKRFFA